MKQNKLKMNITDEQFTKLETETEILNSIIDDLDCVFIDKEDNLKLMFFKIGQIHSHLQSSWADINIILEEINEQNQIK